MHRKTHRRKKDAKDHRSVSVVENRRLRTGKIAQRRVLDLGEIHDSQQAAGRKTREGYFDGERAAPSRSGVCFPKTGSFRATRSTAFRSSSSQWNCVVADLGERLAGL